MQDVIRMERVVCKVISRWRMLSLVRAFEYWQGLACRESFAVGLTLDMDFDKCVGSCQSKNEFEKQLQDDICATLAISKERVVILSHQKGSVVSEIAFGAPNAEGLASTFVNLVETRESTLMSTDMGKRMRNVVLHGAISDETVRMIAAAKTLEVRRSEQGFALAESRLRSKTTAVIRRWMKIKLLHSLRKWIEKTKRRKSLQKIFLRMTNSSSFNAFSAWANNILELQRRRAVFERMVRRMKNCAAFKAYSSWVAHGQNEVRNRQVKTKMISRWVNKQCSRAVARWRYEVELCAQQRAIIQRTAMRMQFLVMYKAYATWADQAKHQRRIQDVCSRVLLKMMNRSLDVFFCTWHANARARAMLYRILGHWAHRTLSAAFAAWLMHLDWVTERYEKAGTVIKMWMHARKGLGTCSDCGGAKNLRIDAFERWSVFTDRMASLRRTVTTRMHSNSMQLRESVVQCFADLKTQAEQRRRTSSHAANLVFASMNRANRIKSFNAWKEFVAKPMMWLNDEKDFDSSVKDLKISFTKIPSQFRSQSQFVDAVVKDMASALDLEPEDLQVIRCDEASIHVRLNPALNTRMAGPEQMVTEIRRQIQDPGSPLRSLSTGPVMTSAEEIRECGQPVDDCRGSEESGPILKRTIRGAQRSAPPLPKAAISTDPTAACSTLSDGSDADEPSELQESGAFLKRTTRTAQRSALPPPSTSPSLFDEKELSRPEIVFEGMNAHSMLPATKMEMALRIHALRRKCESLERVCEQYKRSKGPIR